MEMFEQKCQVQSFETIGKPRSGFFKVFSVVAGLIVMKLCMKIEFCGPSLFLK